MKKTIYNLAYRKVIEELRKARQECGRRQEDVARRLGVSRHWVAKVEACQARLDLCQFVRLCRVYNLSASRLLRRLEEETPEEGGSSFTYQTAPSRRPGRSSTGPDVFTRFRFW